MPGKSPLQAAEAAAAAAPFLFSEAEIGAEKLEATGEFSGERLLARRPQVYEAICRMSAEGLSMSAMARALGVSRNTVAAVQEREGISIEQHKKELLRDVRRAARLSVERVIELIPTINNAKDAAIVAAVMVDKGQLLGGEATARVERVEVNQDKLAEMLASLPLLEAEVVPATGPCAPAPRQRGPAALAAETLPVDMESTVSSGVQDEEPAASANLSTNPDASEVVAPVEPTPAAPESRGGEGVRIFAGPRPTTTDQSPQKILSKGDPSAPSEPPAASPSPSKP